MLAINHTTSATALVLGVSLALDQPFFLPLIAFVVFGSLFPDIDHGDSQISKSIPVLAPFLKHRGPTHSFVGLGVFALITFLLLGLHPALSYIFIFFGFLGIKFLTKILNKQVKRIKAATGDFFSRKQFQLMINLVTIVMLVFLVLLMFFVWNRQFSSEIFWLLLAGYLAHLLGDFLTKEGVPWLWPLKQKFGLHLFKTGGMVEQILGLILVVANTILLYFFVQHFELTQPDYWQTYLDPLWQLSWADIRDSLVDFWGSL